MPKRSRFPKTIRIFLVYADLTNGPRRRMRPIEHAVYRCRKDFRRYGIRFVDIRDSIALFDNFGRVAEYCSTGLNAGYIQWTNREFKKPMHITAQKVYDRFEDSPNQAEAVFIPN